ncbi:MAG: MATE family efflux transporter [Ahrensia sp.]|nr:MATE family efflux transporter [Ahrensia sp.]
MKRSSAAGYKLDITHRSVFAIAWPTTLAYMSTPILGMVDTGVVGRLGDAALIGGLAVGAILFDIVFTTFNFMRASTTGLVAQAFGAGDDEAQQLVLYRSLLLSVVLGMATLVLSPLILAAGLWAMDVPESVAAATSAYFVIRILAAPLTLTNYSVLGWLLGQGRATLGLALQTLLNGSNILLSIWLGLTLGWGIEGVAWATVTAEALTATAGLALVSWHHRNQSFLDRSRLLDKVALWRLFAVNRDIMIRSFCLLFAFAFFTSQGANFGETTLAANAVLMNFFLVSGYFLDGFATAAESLAGRAVGRREEQAFKDVVRLTLFWGFVLAVVLLFAFLLFGPSLIDLLTTNYAVRSQARLYLYWASITALAGVVAFQMDGIYIGATWTRDMRNMMLLSLAVFLAVWWVSVPLIANHGLWLALNVFLAIRGITLYRRLRANRRATFAG